MKVRCSYTKLVPVEELKPHPHNAKLRKHSKEAIERTAKILMYQGWRATIRVSNQSGFITVGHKRLAAAILNGWHEVPVDFQDYDDESQETADVIADNTLNEWDTVDLAGVNDIIPELGPDFDLEHLGIKNFNLDPPNFDPGTQEEQGKLDQTQILECPHCKEHFERTQAKVIA